MQELKLQSSGEVSDKSAKQLGELLGVDAILLGTYMDLGKEVKVNSRMIGTQDGQVMAASSVLFPQGQGDQEAPAAGPASPQAPTLSSPRGDDRRMPDYPFLAVVSIRLGEPLRVGLRVESIGHTSYVLGYELTVDGELVARGRTVQVRFDCQQNTKVPVPDSFRERVGPYLTTRPSSSARADSANG